MSDDMVKVCFDVLYVYKVLLLLLHPFLCVVLCLCVRSCVCFFMCTKIIK